MHREFSASTCPPRSCAWPEPIFTERKCDGPAVVLLTLESLIMADGNRKSILYRKLRQPSLCGLLVHERQRSEIHDIWPLWR